MGTKPAAASPADLALAAWLASGSRGDRDTAIEHLIPWAETLAARMAARYGLPRDSAEAADLGGEVRLALVQGVSDARRLRRVPRGKRVGWLATYIRRRVVDRQRRPAGGRRAAGAPQHLAVGPEIERLIGGREAGPARGAAIEFLDDLGAGLRGARGVALPRDRAVVVLRLVGWTQPAIGRALGISAGRVGQICRRERRNARLAEKG